MDGTPSGAIKCPTCKKEYHGNKPLYDEDRRKVYHNGKVASLTITQDGIFKLLYQSYPHTVPINRIDSVWGLLDVDVASNMRVQICKMRERLSPLGIRIENAYGRISNNEMGCYWLEF